MSLAPGLKCGLLVSGDVAAYGAGKFAPYVMALARLSEYRIVAELPKTEAPVQEVDRLRIMLDVKVDPVAELDRLDKEMQSHEAEIGKAQAKLANESFVARAPANVVAEVKERLATFTINRDRIKSQIDHLKNRG
jgi:valyl-tRNA synthetase